MRRSIALLALATTLGCASGGGPDPVAPADPESAVAQFLDAVRDNSMESLSRMWGTSRGPAADNMDEDELMKRLGIIMIYLQHESYEIIHGTDALIRGTGDERRIRAQLLRAGCQPVVPFTLTRWGGGWLVSNVDLTVIGNPARACEPAPEG